MGSHILLVDDDQLLRRSLAFSLEAAGFRASTAATAEDAITRIQTEVPDIVLLDIGLPGMDGLQALRYFRDDAGIPVIFLTARDRQLDEVMGLELGADDYITKPFDLDILLARIRAVLRRNQPAKPLLSQEEPIVVGDLRIDPAGRTVTVAGRTVALSAREFDLLHTLAVAVGHVVPVDTLLQTVWGPEYEGELQAVYVYIRWLREKLETDPHHPQRILTVRGVGYKLVHISESL